MSLMENVCQVIMNYDSAHNIDEGVATLQVSIKHD